MMTAMNACMMIGVILGVILAVCIIIGLIITLTTSNDGIGPWVASFIVMGLLIIDGIIYLLVPFFSSFI